jgi:NAD(P)-dependent dehydrogenase (short-subunit alcohol dehydrogenase family)
MQSSTSAQSDRRLAGRVAVVTGASRGLGQAIALLLAGEGAHVVAIARTVGGLEELDDQIRAVGGQATLVPQDLMDGSKLDALGPALYERFGRVDILVHAAAHLGVHGPVAHADPRNWDRSFAVGPTTAMRLIRNLDPLLRGSDAGRAVLISDQVGVTATPFWNGYAAAKAAQDLLTLTYAAETAHTNLRVNLFDPGPMATALRRQAFPGEDAGKLTQPMAAATQLLPLLCPDCPLHGQRVRFAAAP